MLDRDCGFPNFGQRQQLLMVDTSVNKAGFWPAVQHVKAEG